MEGCPDRPKSDSPADLGFTTRRMVRWLEPRPLIAQMLAAGISDLFGSYADRREMEAALTRPGDHDYSDRAELWFDYVADTGDGFDPTMTIATLLGRDQLQFADGTELPRGALLILGGDAVYPAASEERYDDRLRGPFRAALPCVPEAEAPDLFAVPGNHDWYDGLTNFLRIFCQGRWLGGWRTRQSRSYFALKLPHGWWLWAIDISFDRDIDQPQLAYFRDVAENRMAPGDHLILCTAKPSWVHAGLRGDEIAKAGMKHRSNLAFFERRVVEPSGARLVVTLSGDLHHYARYANEDETRQKVTSGGGGAYLYPTHNLPERIGWPPGESQEPFMLRTAFPDPTRSRRLRLGALLTPVRNPGFSLAAGTLFLILAWTIQFSLRAPGTSFGSALHAAGFPDLVGAMLRYPLSLLMALALVGAFIVFADGRMVPRVLVGGFHGLVQLGLPLLALWLAARLDLDGAPFMAAALGAVAVGGGIASGVVMGGYLVVTNTAAGFHPNETFAAQHIADHKGFLRCRIGPDGSLTIHPVGIDRICRRWRFRPDGAPGAPWFEPIDPIEPRLMEPPITPPVGIDPR